MQDKSLPEILKNANEVTITVTGRKSGRAISNPVWFVVHGSDLFLVPVQGSETQWYKNVVANPTIRVQAGGAAKELRAAIVSERDQVSSIVDEFREKYGVADVKKYYSNFDVALRLPLR